MSELALKRIHENIAAHQRGEVATFLDLGNCGMTEVPEELGECVWVEELALSNTAFDWDGKEWVTRKLLNEGEPNQIAQLPQALTKLKHLSSLWIHNQEKLDDLSLIAELIDLEYLYCHLTNISTISYISKLKSLRAFSCSDTKISDLSPISGLTNLQTLYCGSTQVSDLGPIAGLTSLQTLSCYSTLVSDLGSISGLTNLQTLYCHSTQISDLDPVARLTNLKILSCNSTQVNDISPILELSNLQELYCSSTQVSDLGPIAGLTSLQTLACSSTQVSDLCPISGLTSLQTLACSSTQVSDLGPISGLTNLQTLYCSSTQVSDLGPISGLTNLQTLYCHSTQVSNLGPVAGLTNLQSLTCDSTQVSDLGPVAGLTNLQTFSCHSTQVSDLAPITGLTNLKVLDLRWNRRLKDSSINPLMSLVKNGLSLTWDQNRSFTEDEKGIFLFGTRLSPNMVAAIHVGDHTVLDYANRKKVPLYEARVLVLGEPRAGKTSLRLKLKDHNASMPANTESTKGIAVEIESIRCNITAAHLATADKPKLQYHLWDFGGQEMYKILHQMFVTEGSAYIIVTNTDVNKNVDELEFWLETIEKLGKSTRGGDDYGPVILFQNPQSDREEYQSFRQLREKFKFWKQETPFVINLNTLGNETEEDKKRHNPSALKKFKEFKGYLENQLQTLSHIGEEIPEEWVRIRKRLGKLLVQNYISLETFRNICSENGITDAEEQMRLSRTLHILGVLMHYQDNELLGNMVILNRQWASDALYRVLDDEIVTKNNGWFEKSDAKKIWGDPQYQDKTGELLELMCEFKMCYLNDSAKRYVVPSKLQLDPPESPIWDETGNVRLHLQYDWLPRPVVTQLMVSLHKHIAEKQSWIWRRGAVIEGGSLEAKDTQARIVENLKEHKIEISAKGNLSEHLIKSIMDHWREVHQIYEGKVEVNRIILCNCDKCKEAKAPFEFDYDDVLEAKAANESLKCNKSRQEMTANAILRGIIDDKTVSQDFQQKFPQYHIHNEMKIDTINHNGPGQMNFADQMEHVQNTVNLTKEQFDKYVEVLELPDAQVQEIKQIEQKAAASGLDMEKVLTLLETLEKNFEAMKSSLPVPVVTQVEEVKKLQTGMSLDGKFKASLPIIPFILNYEIEGKSNLKDVFKGIWQEMKNGEYFLKKKNTPL